MHQRLHFLPPEGKRDGHFERCFESFELENFYRRCCRTGDLRELEVEGEQDVSISLQIAVQTLRANSKANTDPTIVVRLACVVVAAADGKCFLGKKHCKCQKCVCVWVSACRFYGKHSCPSLPGLLFQFQFPLPSKLQGEGGRGER